MATKENFTGSDCTGSDGEANRVLTLNNTNLTNDNNFQVFVNNSFYHLTTNYTVSHKSSSTEITFVNNIWDDQNITVIYVVGISVSSEESTTRLPLSSQLINKEISLLGSSVTIRTITDSSYSKWGDATESTSDTEEVRCMVNVLTQEDELVKEGIFQSGDKLFWFSSSRTDLSRGNRIYHNSLWYEIVEVIEHSVGDNNYLLEVRTKKI